MSQRNWTSADQLTELNLTVEPPDGPYPSLISLDFAYLATLMPDDCRELADMLLSAASEAERWTEIAYSRIPEPRP